MREGGARGGRAGAWNRGLTAQTDERVRESALKMLGTGNPFYGKSHNDVTRSRISITKRLLGETLESRIQSRSSEFDLITSLDDYRSRQGQYLEFRCVSCQHVQKKTLQAFERGSKCEQCFPVSSSQWQIEVEEWVRSLGVETQREDRAAISPKEIDIFIPTAGLGIECHGLYFHSEAKSGNDPKLHARKADLADSRGVRLLQIFFDEWRDRDEVVKGMIKSRLGIVEHRVGARNCQIVEVSASQQRKFFEQSHLAGYSAAKIAWGLQYNGQLIACLSIRKPRQKKWESWWEISRYAVAPNYNVQGGLSRLVRIARDWSQNAGGLGLMTYVDRRVGTGDGYRKCGFVDVGVTGPDYWYTDFDTRHDRFKFRARPGIPELDVAREAGVFRIWGAGSRILTLV